MEPIRQPVRLGDVVAGKYRIERVLGASGMGIVYLATHTTLNQSCAIKFLLASSRNPDGLARFRREARAMAKVHSEHVVRIFDVGELDATTPFIVMDYLEGRDLGSLMLEMGRVPLPFACDVLLQVAEALAAAHAAGVVHRDLKPANIFLAQQADGSTRVKVIDFGVAKLREDTESPDNVTSTSTLVGSPRYMAPEHITGNSKTLDHRSDVWALGVIMQEMLTGRRVFAASGIGQLLVLIATQPPLDIASVLPSLPPPIVELIRATLAKDPAQRTQNVAIFAEAVAPFAQSGLLRAARVRSTLEGRHVDVRESIGKSSWSSMTSPAGFADPTPAGTSIPSNAPASPSIPSAAPSGASVSGASGLSGLSRFSGPPALSGASSPPRPPNHTAAIVAACFGLAAVIGVVLGGISLVRSTRAARPPAAVAAATSVAPPRSPIAESAPIAASAPPAEVALAAEPAASTAPAEKPIPGTPPPHGSALRPLAAPARTAGRPTTTAAPVPAAPSPPTPAATASSRFD